MEKFMISIDWLELYCKSRDAAMFENTESVSRQTGAEYILINKAHPTATFMEMYQLLKRIGTDYREVATIQRVPRLKQISRFAVCVKLSNRFLYSHGPIKELYHIVDLLHLNIQGITRLDLCYDCNKFKHGRNPLRFLKQYISEDYDSSRFIYKVGSNEFRLYGKKSASSETRISGLEFGSNESNFRSYIYDKTRELEVKKDKPWIRAAWEANGLVSDENTHVYRCEISIKARGMDLLNMCTGELFKLSPNFLKWQDRIESLFYIYATRALSFSVRKDAKRVRDFTPIELFEQKQDITCKPVNVSRYKDTGRAEELAASTIQKVYMNYSDLSGEYSAALERAMCFLNQISGQKHKIHMLKEEMNLLHNFAATTSLDNLTIEYLALCDALGRGYMEYSAPVVDDHGEIHDIYTPAPFEDDSLALFFQYCDYCGAEDGKNTPSGAIL